MIKGESKTVHEELEEARLTRSLFENRMMVFSCQFYFGDTCKTHSVQLVISQWLLQCHGVCGLAAFGVDHAWHLGESYTCFYLQ